MKTFFCSLSLFLLLLSGPVQALDVSTINQILTKNRLSTQDLGMIITDEEKKEVFSLNPSKQFTPASVTKVITGAAILELLGPRFQFRTQLLYDGSIVDNTVRGTIYLRGGGDPSFHSGKLVTLLPGLKKHKIKTIDGDLIIDDSRFQDIMDPQWRNQIHTLNTPMFPLFLRLDPEATTDSHQQKSDPVHRKLIDLEGQFVVYQNMIEPDIRSGQTFLEIMQKNGIQLKGKVKRGRVSKSARVLSEIISPSAKLVSQMLKSSNNFYADLLVRNISVAFGERPGSYATGVDFLTFYLDHVKIPRSQYSLNSGSGFSHHNKISPRAMITLLTYVKNEKTVSSTLLSSLPAAGIDGTLRNRMRNTPALGRVRAKTGFLRPVNIRAIQRDGVVSLAGYADALNGKDYTFVFLYNGTAKPDVVRSAFDKICAEIIGPLPTPIKGKKMGPVKRPKKPAKKSLLRSTTHADESSVIKHSELESTAGEPPALLRLACYFNLQALCSS